MRNQRPFHFGIRMAPAWTISRQPYWLLGSYRTAVPWVLTRLEPDLSRLAARLAPPAAEGRVPQISTQVQILQHGVHVLPGRHLRDGTRANAGRSLDRRGCRFAPSPTDQLRHAQPLVGRIGERLEYRSTQLRDHPRPRAAAVVVGGLNVAETARRDALARTASRDMTCGVRCRSRGSVSRWVEAPSASPRSNASPGTAAAPTPKRSPRRRE